MLFVALLKARAGTSKSWIARRMDFKYPHGMKLVAEYWLQASDPRVVSIWEADSVAPVVAAISEWDDYFEVTVVPAIEADEGLQLARHLLKS